MLLDVILLSMLLVPAPRRTWLQWIFDWTTRLTTKIGSTLSSFYYKSNVNFFSEPKKYFELSGIVLQSKSTIGSNFHGLAAKNMAFYGSSKIESIRYDNHDLHFRLLFETRDQAQRFKCDLYYSPFIRKKHLKVNTISELTILHLPARCEPWDYNTYNDFSSPSHSQSGSLSVTSDNSRILNVTLQKYPMSELLMIEKRNFLAIFQVSLVRCHLAPKDQYPQYAEDDENALWMSLPIHQLFDGLDDGIPKMLIEFESATQEKVNHTTSTGISCFMFKVTLSISFQIGDMELSSSLNELLKEGSTFDKKENICRTYVFVADVEMFRTFLDIKAQLVKDLWSGKTLPIISKTEDTARRSSRLKRRNNAVAGEDGRLDYLLTHLVHLINHFQMWKIRLFLNNL